MLSDKYLCESASLCSFSFPFHPCVSLPPTFCVPPLYISYLYVSTYCFIHWLVWIIGCIWKEVILLPLLSFHFISTRFCLIWCKLKKYNAYSYWMNGVHPPHNMSTPTIYIIIGDNKVWYLTLPMGPCIHEWYRDWKYSDGTKR